MTTKEANSKVSKLFNEWQRDFRGQNDKPTDEYYRDLEDFKKRCKHLHDVVGLYEVISDKNALKMASICSSIRFTQPFEMLMQLQKTTKTF